jgi:hypothetical protein
MINELRSNLVESSKVYSMHFTRHKVAIVSIKVEVQAHSRFRAPLILCDFLINPVSRSHSVQPSNLSKLCIKTLSAYTGCEKVNRDTAIDVSLLCINIIHSVMYSVDD